MRRRTFLGTAGLAAAGLGRGAGRSSADDRALPPAEQLRRVGPLVIIGGSEDSGNGSEIHREFLRLSGGEQARIVLITAASEDPEGMTEKYSRAFREIGVASFESLRTPDRGAVDAAENLHAVERATGVFVTGGDQHILIDRLRNTELDRLLHKRNIDGAVIGGTSAGASMMSELMAEGGEEEIRPQAGLVELGYGLDFMPGVLVDQHFSQRGRMGRLLSVVALRPQSIGVGIDANTAMVIRGGDRGHVIGEGIVTIIDAGTSTYNNREGRAKGEPLALFGLRVHTLVRGCGYDFRHRRPTDTNDPRQAIGAGA